MSTSTILTTSNMGLGLKPANVVDPNPIKDALTNRSKGFDPASLTNSTLNV